MLHAQAVFLITVEGRKIRKYARRTSHEGQYHNLERYEIANQGGISRWVILEGQPLHVPDVGRRPPVPRPADSLPGLSTTAASRPPQGARRHAGRADRREPSWTSRPSKAATCACSRCSRTTRAIAIENGKLFRRAEQLAVTDDLTQVYNFRFLKMALRREVKRAARFGQAFSL